MKRLLLLAFFSCCYTLVFAQVESSFSFTSEDENRLIKESDSGKYYVASEDSSNIVFIGDEPAVYRLWDNSKHLLAEGSYSTDGDRFMREGKWAEYYKTGKIKSKGCYQKNNPVGTWEHYYENGKLKKTCNYVIIENGATYYCMAGSYREYFENGMLKVNGLYKATIDDRNKDTLTVEDPISGRKIIKINKGSRPRSEKAGTWEYFSENGELEKKEDL